MTLELADHRYAVAVVTYANTEEEIARLIGGLRSLSGEREGRKKDGKERRFSVPVPPLPPRCSRRVRRGRLPKRMFRGKRRWGGLPGRRWRVSAGNPGDLSGGSDDRRNLGVSGNFPERRMPVSWGKRRFFCIFLCKSVSFFTKSEISVLY